MKESGEKHKGSVEIPNLSEENEVDDTEVGVQHWYGCIGPQFLNKGIIFWFILLLSGVITRG